MADVSQVKLPNGTTYNIKDTTARNTFAQYRRLDDPNYDTINVTELNSGNIINTGAARFLNPINGDISGNAATATKATQDSDGSIINSTYAKKSGTTFTGRVVYNNVSMPLSAGKVTSLAAGTTEIFKDGIAISNPATFYDVGWIRVTGTGESDTVLEIATGDDGGMTNCEKTVVRQYNTSNAIAREAVLLNTDGTSSFPVSVTSPKFIGALQGNADTATKATQDSDGSVINSTYLKLSGGTMTGKIVSIYNQSTSWLYCGQNPDIHINNTGASGWIGGNTKNGRIVLCSYANNDNYLYFNYYTNTTLAESTNKFDKSMQWDGASNTLIAEKYVSNNINSDYYGSSNAITARLTDVNFAGTTAGLGKAKMRLDLVTSSMTGAPGDNSAGYLHTYFWDGTTTAMTQIYIPNGDHVTSTNGPQGLMIRGNDNGEWKDWVKIPTGAGWGASGIWGISITGNAATATTASTCSGNSATATKATQDGNGNVISSTYVKVTGDPTIFKASDIAEGAANLSTQATAHRITVYRNGMTIPYQMDNANDGGMIRVRGTSESNCIFELGTWDDSGAGETIQFNYYPTTSQVTPTYSVVVPKASGTICLTNQAVSNITRSGTTFTATRADGTTFTFTQKDDNTTYGIGNSGESITLIAGGTGTSVSLSTLINGLSTGTSTPVDADYYVSQYVNGGTTTTSYHRRPMSALWTYIKGKADSTYQAINTCLPLAGGTMTGQIVLASTGYKTNSTSGYSVDQYGNFKHQSTNTGEYWVISNNAGTAKLSVYWETGKVVAAGDVQSATVLCANTANSGTAGGLSLYGTDPTQYGVLFRTTVNQGGHGYVTSDWATYFTMSNTNNRGWVFRRQSSGNVASIDTSGQMVLNGSLTVGGNATNTSGARMVYNATLNCIDFTFVA